MTPPHTQVFVVGAGPAGLTAAHLLTRAGHAVVVIERDARRVGGLSRTVSHGGHRLDVMGQRFSSTCTAATALWDELLPGGFVEGVAEAPVEHRGKVGAHLLKAGAGARRLLAGARPLLSTASARLRLGDRTPDTSPTPAAEPAPPPETCRRPRGGPGRVWEAAAEKIQDQGGHLVMGCALQSLSWDPYWRVWNIVTVQNGEALAFTADHVVSSAPLAELAQALDPKAISLMHARALRRRDLLHVVLTVDRARVPEAGLAVHDARLKVARVRNAVAGAADAGPGCVAFEYPCPAGSGLWDLADAELVELASREAEAMGLAKASEIGGGCVVRQPGALPVTDETALHNLRMVRLDLEKAYPTLHLVGRGGLHRDDRQDQAMLTAMLAVENIRAGRRAHDVWAPTLDLEHPASAPAAVQPTPAEPPAPRRAAA